MAKKDPDQKTEQTKWIAYPITAMMIALAIGFISKAGVEIAVPLFGMMAVTAWIALPLWFLHKRRQSKQELELKKAENPQLMAEFTRMKERVENLENLMCTLDREINTQLERSLSSGKINTGTDAAAVSQMPTTFVNVATIMQDRYQVMKELGRGGMGIVFQALDKQLNEPVAVKILSPLLANDPEALERLKREVSAARRISHPNVIRIHDINETKGLHYVSMEFFHGETLKEYIRHQGGLSLMQANQIALQICDGLDAAHRQGVIHRDLKSQNIIINPSNQIKIIDFGLAHSAHLKGMTATGLIMGTPEYMAPEQVAGSKVDERADIYSLGIILYELFTGRVPFTGDSAIAVGFMQVKDAPAPPRTINPQLPASIEAVILKALEKNPAHRQHSVAEVKADLERALLPTTSEPQLDRALEGSAKIKA
ncbi:MAG TPA: protein kinase [Acidobacteriota bacterium]|nr:protein kinase [Acidobacteriota bacterium]